jgi:hypothetical protein
MFDRTERHSTRWIAWMPLLFVSAFLYWSVALGLGGLSLMAAGTLSHAGDLPCRSFTATAIEPVPGHISAGDPIIVHLQESADPDDDQADEAVQPVIDVSDDDGTGRLPGQAN